MKTCVAFMLSLVSLVIFDHSQGRSYKSAPDMTVFGIKLGQKLTLAECPKDASGYDLVIRQDCFQLLSAKTENVEIHFPIRNMPEMLSAPRLVALIIDGNIEGVSFSTRGIQSQNADLQRFKDKYGEPTRLVPAQVQNRMGAKFETFTALWLFPELSVSFVSASTTLDEGLVIIDTTKGHEKRSALMKDASKDRRPL
jgi:hypothetical protein